MPRATLSRQLGTVAHPQTIFQRLARQKTGPMAPLVAY
jgi:hypothetical protein